jgi:hypothetical protein
VCSRRTANRNGWKLQGTLFAEERQQAQTKRKANSMALTASDIQKLKQIVSRL